MYINCRRCSLAPEVNAREQSASCDFEIRSFSILWIRCLLMSGDYFRVFDTGSKNTVVWCTPLCVSRIGGGAGTNLKVGVGGTRPVQSAGIFFMSCPSNCFGSTSTISCFRDGQYGLVISLFAVLLLLVPRAQPFVKVGGHVPPSYPIDSAPLRIG